VHGRRALQSTRAAGARVALSVAQRVEEAVRVQPRGGQLRAGLSSPRRRAPAAQRAQRGGQLGRQRVGRVGRGGAVVGAAPGAQRCAQQLQQRQRELVPRAGVVCASPPRASIRMAASTVAAYQWLHGLGSLCAGGGMQAGRRPQLWLSQGFRTIETAAEQLRQDPG
jgi:hypothetical protein